MKEQEPQNVTELLEAVKMLVADGDLQDGLMADVGIFCLKVPEMPVMIYNALKLLKAIQNINVANVLSIYSYEKGDEKVHRSLKILII